MSQWPSTRAKQVLKALQHIGWTVKRNSGGSHHTLTRTGWANVTWAFHEGEEIGPKMLAKIAKHTGLKPQDL